MNIPTHLAGGLSLLPTIDSGNLAWTVSYKEDSLRLALQAKKVTCYNFKLTPERLFTLSSTFLTTFWVHNYRLIIHLHYIHLLSNYTSVSMYIYAIFSNGTHSVFTSCSQYFTLISPSFEDNYILIFISFMLGIQLGEGISYSLLLPHYT